MQISDILQYHRLGHPPNRRPVSVKVYSLTMSKQLEDENSRLKKIVADLTLDREMLQDVIRRKL